MIDDGTRFVQRRNGRVVIRHNDSYRFRHANTRRDVYPLPDGRERIVLTRPDGVRIITVRGPDGMILRRIRRLPDGREYVLIDNRRFRPGGGRVTYREPALQLDLGPIRITIPRERYIVDGSRASRRDLELALTAPPVERVERHYTLEEVRRFDRLRSKMPRIDLTTITFETNSSWIEQSEDAALAELAAVLNEIIARNPGEVFMIAGHTDLVGDELYNAALSDRRAEAVAISLTESFGVPPENLVTQGYGEQFPVIETPYAERANRRVSVQRITPLLRTSQR